MVKPALVHLIIAQLPLKPNGIHGIFHWARVFENGRRLAAETGARMDVIEYFALLHDSRRFHDGGDYQHGPRAAEFTAGLREDWIDLDENGFSLLLEAIRGHTDGRCEADATVQTCWDSDRLDLMRVGIAPHPARLCTAPAREPDVIAWASRRALDNWIAHETLEGWGIDWRAWAEI